MIWTLCHRDWHSCSNSFHLVVPVSLSFVRELSVKVFAAPFRVWLDLWLVIIAVNDRILHATARAFNLYISVGEILSQRNDYLFKCSESYRWDNTLVCNTAQSAYQQVCYEVKPNSSSHWDTNKLSSPRVTLPCVGRRTEQRHTNIAVWGAFLY